MLYGIQIFFRGFWVSSRGDAILGLGGVGLRCFQPSGRATSGHSMPRPSALPLSPAPPVAALTPVQLPAGPAPERVGSTPTEERLASYHACPARLLARFGPSGPAPHARMGDAHAQLPSFQTWIVQAPPWMPEPSTPNATLMICIDLTHGFALGVPGLPPGHPRSRFPLCVTTGPPGGGVCMRWGRPA